MPDDAVHIQGVKRRVIKRSPSFKLDRTARVRSAMVGRRYASREVRCRSSASLMPCECGFTGELCTNVRFLLETVMYLQASANPDATVERLNV